MLLHRTQRNGKLKTQISIFKGGAGTGRRKQGKVILQCFRDAPEVLPAGMEV